MAEPQNVEGSKIFILCFVLPLGNRLIIRLAYNVGAAVWELGWGRKIEYKAFVKWWLIISNF